MKVLIHYEDNEDNSLYKSLKITLPKSWKTGPSQKLLDQFIETYNAAFDGNQLTASEMHLSLRKTLDGGSVGGGKSEMVDIPSDGVVVNYIGDYADVYVQHGASTSLAEQQAKEEEEKRESKKLLQNSSACTHFGCKKRFPKGGPYPACTFHEAPPVFHETAKFWSCCPNKKAYDWETFQEIAGCQTGTCTDVKEPEQKLFLGGTDLREKIAGEAPLKSIDDFNKSKAAGGADAAPVLDRFQSVCLELGIELELYQQVLNGIQSGVVKNSGESLTEPEVIEAVKTELGKKLKDTMKGIAAEQL
eukprot:CAMPEP_0198143618 /NCGR_PEP_ID=MMETSP1443-20131203/8570_1 /TAXON_ID=186043 /ORGANISM="Entomoneis sp., Strain CCMP2396" /LENGTH=302 /DNA_ID=CAMNT_0043806881 /DNA_START=39 /DNA_END=944 /DNA_ORIENTATION=+